MGAIGAIFKARVLCVALVVVLWLCIICLCIKQTASSELIDFGQPGIDGYLQNTGETWKRNLGRGFGIKFVQTCSLMLWRQDHVDSLLLYKLPR